jgi:hypothetical protein
MDRERRPRLVDICRTIAADMAQDAKDFDGKPFNGRTAAEYFGHQGAAIAALANALAEVLADPWKGAAS